MLINLLCTREVHLWENLVRRKNERIFESRLN